MSGETAVEVGRCGEIPRCPDNVQRGLQEFSSRLRCVFNPRRRLWEIQEELRSSGTWSHVLFWHDGEYPEYVYRPLPFTAEPLIQAVQKLDLVRMGTDLKSFAKALDAENDHKRMRAAVVNRVERARKLSSYMTWARRRAALLFGRAQRGGAAAREANQERHDVLRDLGLRN